MKHCLLIRFLSIILIFNLVFTLFSPLDSAAGNDHSGATGSAAPAAEEGRPEGLLLHGAVSEAQYVRAFEGPVTEADNETVLMEIAERRGPGEKHFLLNDGTRVALQYGYQVHEPDVSGEMRDIDNTLSEGTLEGGRRALLKKGGSQEAAFFMPGEEGIEKGSPVPLLSLSREEGGMTLLLSEENGALQGDYEVIYEEPVHEKGKEVLSSLSWGGVVTYRNVLPGTDIHYQLVGNDIKESICVGSAEDFIAAGGAYRFRLLLEGFTVAEEEGRIMIRDAEGRSAYALEAPYMADAAGAPCPLAGLELVEEEPREGQPEGSSSWSVVLTPDAGWMADPERAYPVVIDPTVACQYFYYDMMKSTSVYTDQPNSNTYQYGEMYIGHSQWYLGSTRGAFRLTCLPVLCEADTVIDATVKFTVKSFSGSGPVVANLQRISQDIAVANLTWNTLQGALFTDGLLDSQMVTAAMVNADLMFDITKTVKEWYLYGNNWGLAFTSENEGLYSAIIMLYTSTCALSPVDRMPKLFLSYLNQEGLEPYLTYHSFGSGSMGSINVSDFSGNLTYTYSDLLMTGASLPAAVSHVYSHHERDADDPSGTGEGGNGSSFFGKGFRLNVTQRIAASSVPGYPYIYEDADGTEHYFTLKTGTAGAVGSTYGMEYASSCVLTKTASGYTLSDGSVTELDFNARGFLAAVRDTSTGSVQTYAYTNGRLTGIIDGNGRTVSLAYDVPGHLTGITDPAGRTTSYSYSGGYLTKITCPDGEEVLFTYASHHGETVLSSVTDIDGSSLAVAYSDHAPYRVISITEYGTDGSEGEKFEWAYDGGRTTVADRRGGSEAMLFDNAGHTVAVTDAEGGAAYGSYNGGADESGNAGTSSGNGKHALSYRSKLQGTTRNFVRNGGFEDGATGWDIRVIAESDGSELTGQTSASVVSGYSAEGQKSLSLCSDFYVQSDAVAEQAVTVPDAAGKTLTLSLRAAYDYVGWFSSAEMEMSVLYQGPTGAWTGQSRTVLKSDSGDTEYRIYSISVAVPSDAISNEITVRIAVKNSGGFHVDCVQLDDAPLYNRYNMIENGTFTDAEGTSVPACWTGENLRANYDGTVESSRGGCAFRLIGETATDKVLKQTVPVKDGLAGDQYVFSAWGYGEPLSHYDKTAQQDCRDYGVRIRFNHQDGTYQEEKVRFEAKARGWQYLSGAAVAEEAYVSVELRLVYFRQKNYGTFEDVQLYRERFGERYEYDGDGRVTKVTGADGRDTLYAYLAPGRPEVSSVTYPDGTAYTYTYDPSTRRLLSETGPDGIVTSYSYDSSGNLTGTSAAAGSGSAALLMNSSVTAWSGAYVSSVTDARGGTAYFSYNALTGTLTSVTDAAGNTASYTYDSWNGLPISEEKAGAKASYSYDGRRLESVFRRTSLTDGVTYGLSYNAFGNCTETAAGSAALAEYAYEAYDGPLSRTDYGNGDYVEYAYDSAGRLVSVSLDGTEAFRYYYDYTGKTGIVQDLRLGRETQYFYDEKGRLSEERALDMLTGGEVSSITYEYDGETGQMTSSGRRYADGGTFESRIYSSRTSGGTKLLSSSFQGRDSEDQDLYIAYSYDLLNRRSSDEASFFWTGTGVINERSFVQGTGGGTTGLVSETVTRYGDYWAYDWTGYTAGSPLPDGIGCMTTGYAYDAKGNITSVAKDGVTVLTYEYDALNELVRENDLERNVTVVYSYDLGGNLLSKSEYAYTTGSVSGLTPAAVRTYTYGNSGWRDQMTGYGGHAVTYDAIGNPLTYYNGYEFTWENGRRLAEADTGAVTAEYAYSEAGIRTSKTVGGVTTEYMLEGSLIRGEKTGTAAVWYYYDDCGSPLGFRYGNGLRDVYLYIKNPQGDVVGIMDFYGNRIVTYTYDTWGKLTGVTTSDTEDGLADPDVIAGLNPFRYRGYYYDVETGFYYCSSRYYDPETGRWLNADGLISTGQGILGYNMYAYCANDPVVRCDPSGGIHVFIRALEYEIGGRAFQAEIPQKTVNILYQGTYRSGNIMIVSSEEDAKILEKGNTGKDVIIIDLRTGTNNPDMQVRNSYRISKRKERKEIIRFMLQYDELHPTTPSWGRTEKTMMIEWDMHNLALIAYYNDREILEKAIHCDFDFEDEALATSHIEYYFGKKR